MTAARAAAAVLVATIAAGAAVADAPPPAPHPIVLMVANMSGRLPVRVTLEQCDSGACAHPSSSQTLTCLGQTCSGYAPGFDAFLRLVLAFRTGPTLSSGVFRSTPSGVEYRATVSPTGIRVQPQP